MAEKSQEEKGTCADLAAAARRTPAATSPRVVASAPASAAKESEPVAA